VKFQKEGRMKEILRIFEEIAKIPHCSGNTDKLKNFIIDFIKKSGYSYKVDKAGNILAFKKEPLLALQSHYDMVCVGEAPNIELIYEKDYLKAKNSSLGADNGIGVAVMLYLMKKYDNLEFLFTNDEEIGLIGAFNLELDLKSKYLLNLDSEDENIYIGCAGGVDVLIEYPINFEKKRGVIGEISIDKLPGGHSGVDIDKNYPNAIVEILKRVNKISFLRGGERRNSIPVFAKAGEFYENEYADEVDVIEDDYLEFLRKLPHGVLEWDFKFKVVSKSVNLAMVDNEKITLSIRANSNEKLEELKEYIKEKTYGAKIKFDSEYPAWKPEISKLAEILKDITKSEYKVIHAGLECGILKNKFPHIAMASIGPIIYNPHSIYEKVYLPSIEKILNAIENLIKRIENE